MSTRRTVNMVFLSAAILISTAIPATAVSWEHSRSFVEEDTLSSSAVVVQAEGPPPSGAAITTSGTCDPFSCRLDTGDSWEVHFDPPVAASSLRIQVSSSDDNDGIMQVDVNADDSIDHSLYVGPLPVVGAQPIHVRGKGNFGRISAVKIMPDPDSDVTLDYVALENILWILDLPPFYPIWTFDPDIYFAQDMIPLYVDLVPAEGPAPPEATITTSGGVLSVPGVKSSSRLIFPGEWWMVEFDHPVAADRLRIQLYDSDDNDGTMHVDVDADGTIDYSYYSGQAAGTSRDTLVFGAGFRTIRAVKIIAANDGEVSLDYVALGRQLTIFPAGDGRWSGGEWRGSPDEAKAIPWTDFFVPAQGPEPIGAMIGTRVGSTGCPPTDWPPGYEQFCWLYGMSEDWWRVNFFPELDYLKMYIRFRDCDNNDGWAEVWVNGTRRVAYDSYYPTEPGNNPTNGLLVGRGLPPISSVEIKTIPGDGDVSLDYVAFSDPPIPPN